MPAAASCRATAAPMPRPPPVTSATPLSSSANGATDLLERLRVLERREIAGIRSERLRPHGAAHDLRAPRLRQRCHEDDPIRPERLPELRCDQLPDLGSQPVAGRHSRTRDAEEPGDLALDLVRDTHRRRLELRRPDPLAGDVERVVGAPVQEPVAVLVDGRPVAVRPDPGEPAPVRLEIALRVAPEPARHPGKRLPAHELADLP